MYECHKCHKEFNSDKHLKYHLAFNPKHKDDLFDRDDYTCPECDEDCFDKEELRDHLDNEHNDDDAIGGLLAVGLGLASLGADFENNTDTNDDFSGFSDGETDGGGSDDSW